MKLKQFIMMTAIVSALCLIPVFAQTTDSVDFIIGPEKAYESEYYQDFLDGIEEVAATVNILLANHPKEDGSVRTITEEDIDFTKMYKCYVPTENELSEALSTDFSSIPLSWNYIWILPITVDGYTVRCIYQLYTGIAPELLQKSENSEPAFTDEEIAMLEAKRGHFILASGTAAPTSSFLRYVLSSETLDMSEADHFCYISSHVFSGRIAWVSSKGENRFCLTNSDDDETQSPIWLSQEEFLKTYTDLIAKEHAEYEKYNGEDVYGGISDTSPNMKGEITEKTSLLCLLISVVLIIAVICFCVMVFRKKASDANAKG